MRMIVLKVANIRKIGLITKTTGINQILGYDPTSATNEIKFSKCAKKTIFLQTLNFFGAKRVSGQ